MGKLFKKSNFTVVSNSVIFDQSLSFKAKGIYGYLCSRPDGWEFFMTEISGNSTDGIDSVRTGLKELEQCGYLKRHRGNNQETGKIEYDYEIFETPEGKDVSPHGYYQYTVEPHADNPATVKSNCINTDLTLKTDLKEKKEKSLENRLRNGFESLQRNRDSISVYLGAWKRAFGTDAILTGTMERECSLRLAGIEPQIIVNTVMKYANALQSDDSWVNVRKDAFDFLTSGKYGFNYFLNATDALSVPKPKKAQAKSKNWLDD